MLLCATFIANSVTAGPANALPATEGTTAAYLHFRIGQEPGGEVCSLELAPGTVTVNIVAYAVPFQKLRFSLPDPPIGTIVGESWGVSYTGDRINGLEVDMGGCTAAGWVTIGHVDVMVGAEESIPCTVWAMGADCEVQDCAGVWLPARAWDFYEVEDSDHAGQCRECFQECYDGGPLPPYNLYPPDGATNVPVDVVLTWDGVPFLDDPYPDDFTGCSVVVSSDPSLANGQGGWGHCNSFAPALQPNTTYYWSAGWYDTGTWCSDLVFQGATRVYSFTTEAPLSTTTTTWGRVKAMYRD